ncbi:hypothetical protein [Sorangium sp. So ce693]|uniref:hypothetical protein n=1 Tax=Sorangium sp. So ce693 TaxID=3133318 RepID=UPI003F5E4064
MNARNTPDVPAGIIMLAFGCLPITGSGCQNHGRLPGHNRPRLPARACQHGYSGRFLRGRERSRADSKGRSLVEVGGEQDALRVHLYVGAGLDLALFPEADAPQAVQPRLTSGIRGERAGGRRQR